MKNAWNIRRLVNESFVTSTQRPSVLYWRLSDFWCHVLSIYARWFIVIQLPNRWLLVSDGPAPPRPLHKLYDILVKEGVWDAATIHIVYITKKRFKKFIAMRYQCYWWCPAVKNKKICTFCLFWSLRRTAPRPGVYQRLVFKIRPNILIGQKKLQLRPKDRSRSRLLICSNFLSQFSWFYPISTNVNSVVEF